MRINITDEMMSLEEFKEMLNSSKNIKDVHMLCHQCGFPVYVIRDVNDNCGVMWHLSKDDEKNVIKAEVMDEEFKLKYDGKVIELTDLESLQKDMFTKHMLGDTPFDENFCIWKKV